MKLIPFFSLLFVLLLGAQATSNKASSEGQPFVGQWHSTFEGKEFMHLAVRDTDPLSGHLKTGEIAVDSSGKVIFVAQAGDTDDYDIVSARVLGRRMFFHTKEEDGETTKYELHLQADGSALLTVQAEGVKVQPFVMTRARP